MVIVNKKSNPEPEFSPKLVAEASLFEWEEEDHEWEDSWENNTFVFNNFIISGGTDEVTLFDDGWTPIAIVCTSDDFPIKPATVAAIFDTLIKKFSEENSSTSEEEVAKEPEKPNSKSKPVDFNVSSWDFGPLLNSGGLYSPSKYYDLDDEPWLQ